MENIKLTNTKTFFGLAKVLAEDFEHGVGTVDTVPDSPQGNTGVIAVDHGMSLEEGPEKCLSRSGVAHLLSELLQRQLKPREHAKKMDRSKASLDELIDVFHSLDNDDANTKVEENFECALTRYQGQACFYLVLPQGSRINGDRLRKDVADVRAMMTEVAEPSAAARRGPQRETCWFGPIESGKEDLFLNTLGNIARFHGFSGGSHYQHLPSPEGSYFALPRRSIEPVLKKEGLALERGNHRDHP